MYGRKNRGKRSSRRVVVTLLTFVMLLSMCFPGMMASAGEMETTAPSESEESILETTGAGIAADSDATENTEQTETTGVAEATGSTEATDATEETEATEAVQDSAVTALYNRLMAATTYDELSSMMDAMTEEEYVLLNQFTDEQNAALTALVAELEEADAEILGPDDNFQPGGGNELDPTKYNKDSYVFYDTMTPTYNTDGTVASGTVATGDRSKITSVTLNTTAVVQGDSSATSWTTTNASQLSTYFTSAEASSSSSDTSTMQAGTLVITPAPGYYVSAVVIACTSRTTAGTTSISGSNPYRCNTWAEGNAFTDTFDIGTGGAATVNLSSLDFSHASQADVYFILISVLPVPEPLYVEYDYGIIGDKLGDALSSSAFNHVDNWTDDNANNVYGTGGNVLTDDTQFEYAYEDSSEAANWKHYANAITSAAREAAASVGYYFTGWTVEYYTTYTIAENTDAADNENKYTINFPESESYGTATATPGSQVSLITHCRIIAQWAPITLTVQKTVEGLTGTGFVDAEHSYTINVEKLNADGTWSVYATKTLSVTGNDSVSEVISPVTPGTYRVVEADASKTNLTVGNTTMYITVTDKGETTVAADGSTTSATLTVTNTYSSARPMIKLVKKWLDADGNALTGAATANLPAVTFHLKDASGNVLSTQMVNYNGSWTISCDVPADLASVTEVVPDGYKQVGDIAVTTENDTDNQIFYTIYTATNQQDTADITISKTVSGNMGDINKSFEFTATLQDANGNALTFPAPEEGENYTVTDNVANFTLAHGGSIIIDDLPIGSKLTVNETNATAYEVLVNNEEVKAKGVSGNATGSASITADTSDNLAYENINEALIDTGLELTTFPFVLLFCTAAGLGAVLLSGKRRYRF